MDMDLAMDMNLAMDIDLAIDWPVELLANSLNY